VPFAGVEVSGPAEAEATSLLSLRWSAMEQLSEAALMTGALLEAEQRARAVTVEAPLREDAWRLLALAQYAAGRSADALATLRAARQTLADALGIAPGARLEELESHVLRREVVLPAQPPPSADSPVAATLRPAGDGHAPIGAALVSPAVTTGVVAGAPVQLRPFVGRAADLDAVATELRRRRLVTDTGPGGCGKTRLAIAVAEQVAHRYRDGAAFVTLQNVSDVPAAWSVLARGLAVEAATAIRAAVVRALSERGLLLVLDNLEHLDGSDAIVADLLGAPDLCVLATSRGPLLLSGEQEFPLEMLPVPHDDSVVAVEASDAGRFFCDCARAARNSFVLDAMTAPAVAGLCRRLDGLPLALELAAAQLRFFSPAALLAHLGQRLSVELGRGLTASDRPDRHRTLGSAIAYSYDLLDDYDQRVFRALGVFAGPVAVQAVEAIMDDGTRGGTGDEPRGGTDGEVLESLIRLAIVGLVRAAPGSQVPCFGMLDTIRDYATWQLRGTGDEGRVRRRHLHWCRDMTVHAWNAVTFDGDDAQRTIAHTLLDEVRAALNYAFGARAGDDDIATTAADMLAAAAIPWIHVSGAAEVLHWIDVALAALPAGDDRRDRELRRLRTYPSIIEGSTESAVVELRRLLDSAAGDDLLAARVHSMLGLALVASGRYDEAVQECLLAASHAERVGAFGLVTSGRINASGAALDAGQYETALNVATQLRDLVARRGLAVDLVYYTVSSCACAKLGRLAQAGAHLGRALELLRSGTVAARFDMLLMLAKAATYLAVAMDQRIDVAQLSGWWSQGRRANGITTEDDGVYARMGVPAAEWDALRRDIAPDDWLGAAEAGAALSFDECLALIAGIAAAASRSQPR
jgi:predicted ATPase